MALLFCDSFDHYVTADMFKKWGSGGGTIGAVGRNGTNGMDNPSLLRKVLIPGDNTFIVGFAVKPTLSNGFQTIQVYDFYSPGFTAGGFFNVATLETRTDGSLRVHQGAVTGPTLGTTAAGTVTAGSHHFIEMKYVIHATLGTVEVRVSTGLGRTVTVLSLTGQNTKGSTAGVWNMVELGPQGNGWDDFYICDGTGAAPWNTFLGNVFILCDHPVTDAVSPGTHADLTPSSGTDHGATVDETNANVADYNAGSVVGNRDSYKFPAAATASKSIFGVQVCVYAEKTESQARAVAPSLLVNGVDHDGPTTYLNRSGGGVTPGYLYYCAPYGPNPETGVAWTHAGVDAAEPGVVVKV